MAAIGTNPQVMIPYYSIKITLILHRQAVKRSGEVAINHGLPPPSFQLQLLALPKVGLQSIHCIILKYYQLLTRLRWLLCRN